MRHALFRTLPGRAIVVGLVVTLFVVFVMIALGYVPPISGRSMTRRRTATRRWRRTPLEWRGRE
jgi:hypothetical protein